MSNRVYAMECTVKSLEQPPNRWPQTYASVGDWYRGGTGNQVNPSRPSQPWSIMEVHQAEGYK